MQIKTFLAVGHKELDNAVNKWLDEHKNVEIAFPSSTSIIPADHDGNPVYLFSMTIWYRKKGDH